MAHLYCPDRFEAEVRLYICKLTSCEKHKTLSQEERTKKKKKQKEINKKEEELTHTPRKAHQISSFIYNEVPTLDEIKAYMEEKQITNFGAEQFFDYYTSKGWTDKDGQPIADWKAKVNTWSYYEQRKNKNNAKRQTDSANASGTQTNRGGECVQPRKARHEQLQEILQEEHFVLASVGAELEGVVAASMASNKASDGKHGSLPWLDGTDDRLSTLAADFGPHAVIVWLSKVFEATLQRLEVPEEKFSARQVVQVAEGLMRVLDVYKGLTARQVLRAMEKMQPSVKIDIMEILYKELKQ